MKEYIAREDAIKYACGENYKKITDIPTVTKADILQEFTERLHKECAYYTEQNEKMVIDLKKWYKVLAEMEQGE